MRLAQGEFALQQLADKGPLSLEESEKKFLAAGVRVVKDLVTPRVHMEVTVCGAVPPFDVGLGGKLVISFLAHPSIIDLGCSTEGSVLKQSFDVNRLSKLLPSNGLLAITTKGLYARHAPMYHRASVPGPNGPVKIKHEDDTEGATTSFISTRTSTLAKQLLASASETSDRRVSFVYGTGGASDIEQLKPQHPCAV